MDNKTITAALNQIHNVWWKKWRDKDLDKDSPAWEDVTKEAGAILDEFDHHPFVVHLIQDLLDELERRSHDGGKERT